MNYITPRKIKGYGWKRGLPDHRRWKYANHFNATHYCLPPAVDLRPLDVPIYDQGNLGSCTGNAIVGMCQFVTKKLHPKYSYLGSRLSVYYNERVIEGDVAQDSGASLADGMTVIHKQGVPNDKNWPYIESKFAVKPPGSVYTNGMQHTVPAYYSIDNSQLVEMKNCLSAGFPFVFGFSVYASFQSGTVETTGIVPMPGKKEQMLGGHAVVAVGYDDTNNWLICRNSWGAGWGVHGYFFLPYAYASNPDMADEFFTIRDVKAY